MKTLVFSVVVAAALGVVLSLPFNIHLLKKEALIPRARSLGATEFAHVVHKANLTANFTRKAGNFTLFVPVNTAWKDLSKNITGNKTLLSELVLFHSVNGTFRRNELKNGTKLRTLSGKFLFFNVTKDKSVLVNGVNITKYNQRASNGYIYLISEVILNGSGVNNKTNTTKPSKISVTEKTTIAVTNAPSGSVIEIHQGKKEALIPHVRSLGATKFAHYVHEADLQVNFTKKAGNFTLFVPVNTALEDLSKNITGNKTVLKELILFHSVNGTFRRNELKNGTKLKTLSGKFLYVNVTKDKSVFVNGVNITSFNNRASNGEIFLLGKVILNGSGVRNGTNTTKPTKTHLLFGSEIIVGKKEALIPRVRSLGATKFAHYVHEADLQVNFTKKAGNFTLFVPVNTAWEDLSKNIAGNKTVLKELILFHSVNGTFRRNELKNGTKLKTLSGKFLYVNVTKDKSVFVNGVNITSFNNRASNGEIFLLGKVILNGSGVRNGTNTTKPTKTHLLFGSEIIVGKKEALIPRVRSLGATKFAHYVHEADLHVNFTKKAGNFTLFVPVNTAWEDLSKNITGNKTVLKELILFHSVNGTFSRKELKNNTKLKTLSGKFLCVNVTKDKSVLINGVNITKFNQWALNGNIFLLGEVILNGSGVQNKTNSTTPMKTPTSLRRQAFVGCPWESNCTSHGNGNHSDNGNGTHVAHGSITHILAKNWNHFSSLITDLMKTGVWSELESYEDRSARIALETGPSGTRFQCDLRATNVNEGHVTLLAPNNAAFHSLSSAYRHNLDNDPNYLKKTLRYHILNGVHAPNTLHHDDYVTTHEGQRVHIIHLNGHVAMVNKVAVNNVIPASNGYIYVLSSVLHAPTHPIV